MFSLKKKIKVHTYSEKFRYVLNAAIKMEKYCKYKKFQIYY